jgi:hypothetical protein
LTALFLGFKPEEAARFSFLASNALSGPRQVQRKVLVVGVFPTMGSNGQFCVHDASVPGRRATVVNDE